MDSNQTLETPSASAVDRAAPCSLPEKCPYCGAAVEECAVQLQAILPFACGATYNKLTSRMHERARTCYERELATVRAERDSVIKRTNGWIRLKDFIIGEGPGELFRLQEAMKENDEGNGAPYVQTIMTYLGRLWNKNHALRTRLAALPADWSNDSSLETWFPLTAQELAEVKTQRDMLRSVLESVRYTVCHACCPTLKRTEQDWTHGPECHRVAKALAAIDPPRAENEPS